jgi:hypothetical protein
MKKLLLLLVSAIIFLGSCDVQLTSVNIRVRNSTAAATFAANCKDATFSAIIPGATTAYQQVELRDSSFAFIVSATEQGVSDPFSDTTSVAFEGLHGYTIIISDRPSGGYVLSFTDDGEV